MKKKILMTTLLVMLVLCLFALSVSAATTSSSFAIEFKVMLEGETEYIPVYSANTDSGNPQLTFNNGFFRTATYDESTKKFTFSDEVDQSTIIKIDFSEAVTHKSSGTVVKRVSRPTNPLTSCTEVKWFAASGSVTDLPQFLFKGWTALNSFDFGTVTVIDTNVFENTGFVDLVIPSQVTWIKNTAFGNCTSLKTVKIEGTLPNGIGGGLFQNCTALETATLNELTTLSVRMFKGCTALETVTAPKATIIQEEAFGSTLTSLTTLTLNYSEFTSVDHYAFQNLTCIPENLDLSKATKIGNSAFSGCTGLKSVNLSSATSIGSTAFADCTSLVTVVAPNVTSIGNKAFGGCTALTDLSKMPLLATIGNETFQYCPFTSFEFSSAITSIGNKAFYKCTSLKTVTFPETVTSMALNGNTFSDCTALESVNLPEGITKLGNYELYKTAVKTIHIPSTVTSIGYQFAEESAVETLTFAENSQLKFIDHRAFRLCKSLSGVVILPDGLEEMDYGVFVSCTSLKAVKMPDTLNKLSGDASTFNGCSSLEYVQFSKNLTGTIYKSMFENCTSLKAISFPDGVTKIDYKALRNCTSLEAIYLPSGLQELGSVNTSASDWGVFYQSPKVYLVNEPFDVFDGDELIENFVMPAKPEVYYMPSGMTALGNSAFQNCTNLNRYIVFPTGITSVGECSQGAFFKASSSTNPVTFVFLGDMTSIRIRQNDSASSNMSFLFANPNDTGITSMSFIIGSANNGYQTNSYAYFCASNTVYDLTTFKATNSTTYTVTEEDYTKTVNTAETQPHFVDPKKTVSTDATCETNKSETTYCFCNALIGTTEVENTALGHNHDTENGATLLTITYADFTKNGYKEIQCSRCENVNTEVAVLPIIIFDGYSVDQATKSIFAIGFRIDKDAIDTYEEATGNTVTFGIIGVLTDNLSEKDENGNVVNTFKPLDAPNTVPVIKATVPETVTAFNLKIRGFNTDEYRALDITMSALVTVTDSESNENTVYIQNAQVESPSAYSVAQYIADNA